MQKIEATKFTLRLIFEDGAYITYEIANAKEISIAQYAYGIFMQSEAKEGRFCIDDIFGRICLTRWTKQQDGK